MEILGVSIQKITKLLIFFRKSLRFALKCGSHYIDVDLLPFGRKFYAFESCY